MKLFEIDNPDFARYSGNVTQIITKGKKAVMLPANAKIIETGGYLPHLKSLDNCYTLKYCVKCKRWIFLHGFIKNKHSKDGYKDCCRHCDNKRRRERYAKRASV